MDPLTAGALIKTGGDVLGAGFGYLGGRGRRREAKDEYTQFRDMFQTDRDRMLGIMDDDLFDPLSMTQYAQRGLSMEFDQLLPKLNTELGGISSSQAKGALMAGSGRRFQDMFLEMLMKNKEARYARRGRTSEVLAGQSGGQLSQTRRNYFA